VSKYSKGADFERAVVKHLEKLDYVAFRCAGSKGNSKVDIIAFTPVGIPYYSVVEDAEQPYRPHLIQSKTSGIISKFEKKRLKEAAEKYGCIPVLASKGEDGKIKFECLNE
jgi:Holliday junction resolvase